MLTRKLNRLTVLFLLGLLAPVTLRAQWVQAASPEMRTIFSFVRAGADIYAGGVGGVFLSTDNGTSWERVLITGRYSDVVALAASGSNLVAGTPSGSFLSTDNGTSWTPVGGPLTNRFVASLLVSGESLFAGTVGYGVYLSTDDGATWTDTNSGLTGWVRALAASGMTLFAGTSGDTNAVFRSTDRGKSWQAVLSASGDALAVLRTNLFVGGWGVTYNGIYRSTNDGSSWTSVTAGLTSPHVHSLFVSDTNLFAGTEGGVFLSTDAGATWTLVNAGLTETVYSFCRTDSHLVAGTYRLGVWRRPLSELITSVEKRTGVPSQFGLQQNYPNPFNPSTTIRYGLPERSEVLLTVFNTLGQQVATLAQGEQEAGYHEVRLDGSGLSSGVYFYRLTAESYTQTRKLLLER